MFPPIYIGSDRPWYNATSIICVFIHRTRVWILLSPRELSSKLCVVCEHAWLHMYVCVLCILSNLIRDMTSSCVQRMLGYWVEPIIYRNVEGYVRNTYSMHSKVWFIMAASISATMSTSGKGTKGSVLALCSRGCPSHCRQTSHSASTRRSLTR